MEHLESALRPVLQPITQNLPGPIRDVGISLLGNHCYKTLVHDVQLSDASCFKLAISKGLGIGIIGASAVVKIPQLLKLLNSQSAAGLSFLAYALETSSYLISLAYNARMGFPFSTYGETAFIAIQNVAIAALILQYSGKGAAAAAFVAGLAAAGYSLFNPNVIDMKTMSLLQAGAGALGVASKLPQIITVWQQGGTGQLSAFAVFNYLFGSLSRIFTTLQEVDDKLILYGFISGFVLNAVLALQMIYYWNSAPSKVSAPSHKLNESGRKEAIAMTTSAEPKGKSPSTRRRG
ncbi:mannose-P-dolichol utilization defect 1 protein, partial [Aureobasidium melanogenum]|uniref:Mannose-P-dolichol utilization defect 1 protein homolog n=1 Tax=Aureobasidium melanogenum (strain CBS 110374) TaxID=1043003 RepID=A0A074W060_AURM1